MLRRRQDQPWVLLDLALLQTRFCSTTAHEALSTVSTLKPLSIASTPELRARRPLLISILISTLLLP